MRLAVKTSSARARALAPSDERRPAIAAETYQRGAERFHVPGWHHQAGLAVAIDPGHAGRQRRADDGTAGEHRFDLDHAERFLPAHGWQRQQVAAAIPLEPLGVGHVAEEPDRAGEAQLARQRLQRAAQRPVADDDERGGDTSHGPQQHVHALVGDQPADEEHRRRAARARCGAGRRRREGPRIEPVRDDDDLVLEGGERRHVAHRRRRDDDASGAPQHPVQQRLVEQPVLPLRPDHLAVEPDNQRRCRTRERGGHERHRVRLVQHHDVGLGAAQPPGQRGRQRHRPHRGQAGHARDRYPVHGFVDRAAVRVQDQGTRLDEGSGSRARRFEHGLDAAAVRRVVLAEVQDLEAHQRDSARASGRSNAAGSTSA